MVVYELGRVGATQGGRVCSSHEEYFLTRSEPWGEGMADMRDNGLPS